MWPGRLHPSSRLATIDVGRKLGGCAPLGVLGPQLTQSCLVRGLPPYQWHLSPSSRLTTTDMSRTLGNFRGGQLGSHLTQCRLGRGYLRTKWHPDACSRFATIDMDEKFSCTPFWGRCVRIYHNVAWDEAYLHTKWHLDASSRLATIEMGRKLGASAPFLGRGAMGPHLVQCGLDRGPPPCQVPF